MKAQDYIGKTVLVTKLEDLKFNGQHPNFINPGYTTTGQLAVLDVGDYMYIAPIKMDDWNYLRTSIVESIKENEDHLLVTTRNSVYKVKIAC
jgi:hypothetical protein